MGYIGYSISLKKSSKACDFRNYLGNGSSKVDVQVTPQSLKVMWFVSTWLKLSTWRPLKYLNFTILPQKFCKNVLLLKELHLVFYLLNGRGLYPDPSLTRFDLSTYTSNQGPSGKLYQNLKVIKSFFKCYRGGDHVALLCLYWAPIQSKLDNVCFI